MKGNASPSKPHFVGDLKTGVVTGGIAYDIFDTIAKHYGVSSRVRFETVWIVMNEDGSLGGMIGHVSPVLGGINTINNQIEVGRASWRESGWW